MYDASLRKVRYKGKFEFNYITPSQIVIQTLSTGNRVVIKTMSAPEITRINVL
jgi:intraflagellar transport protein 172